MFPRRTNFHEAVSLLASRRDESAVCVNVIKSMGIFVSKGTCFWWIIDFSCLFAVKILWNSYAQHVVVTNWIICDCSVEPSWWVQCLNMLSKAQFVEVLFGNVLQSHCAFEKEIKETHYYLKEALSFSVSFHHFSSSMATTCSMISFPFHCCWERHMLQQTTGCCLKKNHLCVGAWKCMVNNRVFVSDISRCSFGMKLFAMFGFQ